ncbi:MAG: 5-formyltetrahydrofolate cyclo-ligase [bacterium]
MTRNINKRQKPIWQKIKKPTSFYPKTNKPSMIKNHYLGKDFSLNYQEKENVKQELRNKLLHKRNLLKKEKIEEKSRKIKERLFSLQEVSKAQIIFTYVNFGSEVATREIIMELIKQKKKVAVPLALPKEKRLLISEIKNMEEELEIGTFGILEPKVNYRRIISPQEVDLVIVPGVVFDQEGYRIGYGGGYYDRFLLELRKDVTCLGLAFQLQIVKSFPRDLNDLPVHLIVTEKETIKPGPQKVKK